MNRVLLLIFLTCCSLLVKAQIIGFQKTFGGINNDWGFSIVSTPDGGYAMAGSTQSYGAGASDVLLLKLDAGGNMEWSRAYGGSGTDEAITVVTCTDGGFAICGKTDSYGQGSYDALLIRTDSIGNLLWMKTYGGINEERLLHIRQTFDKGFILSGSTISFGQGSWDMLFIKTDSVGDTLWTKILGGPSFDQGTDAAQTSDSGFIVSGRQLSWGAGSVDMYLAKLNADGDTAWTHAYGGVGWDEGLKVKQTFDGGYIVTGASNGFTLTGGYDAYLTKLDNIGNLTWSKVYSGSSTEATYDVLQLSDSGYIIIGETESFGSNHSKPSPTVLVGGNAQNISTPFNHTFGTDNSNILLIRTNSFGDTLWARAYGDSLQDEGYGVTQTLDNGFAVAAYSISPNTDSIDVYLIKTDSNGYSGCYQEVAAVDVTNVATIVSPTSTQITSGLVVGNIVSAAATAAFTQNDICFATGLFEHIEGRNTMALYPNPFNQTAIIKLPELTNNLSDLQLSIYDICGRSVKNITANSNETIQLNAKDFVPGIYFAKLILKNNNTENLLTCKFVI